MPDIDFGVFVGVVMAIVPAVGVWVRLNITITKLCAEAAHLKERVDGMGGAMRREFQDIEKSRVSRVAEIMVAISKVETSIVKLWDERDRLHDSVTKLKVRAGMGNGQ
jgi:hypothetical protein